MKPAHPIILSIRPIAIDRTVVINERPDISKLNTVDISYIHSFPV